MVHVTINLSRCTGEGTCLKVCPISNFELKRIPGYERQKSVVLDLSACLVCKTCEFRCPEQAIKVMRT